MLSAIDSIMERNVEESVAASLEQRWQKEDTLIGLRVLQSNEKKPSPIYPIYVVMERQEKPFCLLCDTTEGPN